MNDIDTSTGTASTSVDVSDVLTALLTAQQAISDEQIARNEYDGYSWGWHGSALLDERDRAVRNLGETLDAYVATAVRKAIAEMV